jgi:F-type H+-transporting ATPase subunit b
MPPLPAALLMAAFEGGGGKLTDVNFGLTLWTAVVFALFAFVLGKFAWRPLLDLIELRERTVRDQVQGAEKAHTEAQALLADSREKHREAAHEREEMILKAMKEAEQVRADLVGKARTEAEHVLQRAREQTEREKSLAILELRSQVADVAVEAAAKIVTSSLTVEAQKKLVNDYIATLPRLQ